MAAAKEFANFTLADVEGGRLAHEINERLKQMVEDIADPNKKATVQRSISIKITAMPANSRREFAIMGSVNFAPAAYAGEPTVMFIGKDPVTGEKYAQPDRIDQPIIPGVEKAFHAREGDEETNDAN